MPKSTIEQAIAELEFECSPTAKDLVAFRDACRRYREGLESERERVVYAWPECVVTVALAEFDRLIGPHLPTGDQ